MYSLILLSKSCVPMENNVMSLVGTLALPYLFSNEYQSINQLYFQISMHKNEQNVQFTVINVQGNHVHLKEHLTCKTNFTN